MNVILGMHESIRNMLKPLSCLFEIITRRATCGELFAILETVPTSFELLESSTAKHMGDSYVKWLCFKELGSHP